MLPPEQLREHLAKVHAMRVAAGAKLAAELSTLLPQASRVLREQFGAKRVLLFGSYARGTPTSSSDVDLAVEGMEPRRQFLAMGALATILRRHVDLVVLEDLPPVAREHVERDCVPV